MGRCNVCFKLERSGENNYVLFTWSIFLKLTDTFSTIKETRTAMKAVQYDIVALCGMNNEMESIDIE